MNCNIYFINYIMQCESVKVIELSGHLLEIGESLTA